MKNNTITLNSRIDLSDIRISGPISGRVSELSYTKPANKPTDEGYTYLSLYCEPSPGGYGPPKKVSLSMGYTLSSFPETGTDGTVIPIHHSVQIEVPVDTILEWARVLSAC